MPSNAPPIFKIDFSLILSRSILDPDGMLITLYQVIKNMAWFSHNVPNKTTSHHNYWK
jgi:hypothetical protein